MTQTNNFDSEITKLTRKLNRAERTLKTIMNNKPTLMHNSYNRHEVLVYPYDLNPSKLCKQCLEDMECNLH